MRLLLFNLATDADDPVLGFTTRWIRAFAKQVQFINVITMRAGRLEVPANVRVYSVGKEKGYGEARRAIEFYRCLFRILREDCIDFCFSHMIPIFTVLAAPVLKSQRISIATWHSHRQVTNILKVAHYCSDRMVTSAPTAYRYRHDKLVISGQGIDVDLFSPDGRPLEHPPLVISVGRLASIKDLGTLIKAVHLLRRRGHDARCALVGAAAETDQPYVDSLHRLVRDLNLDETVRFAGAVRNDQLVTWYRKSFAHVNLCPTGALDKAVLEAMACERPSLMANEGFRETLNGWGERLLFRHGDPDDLADKLDRLLQMNNGERAAMSADLRKNVIARHNLEHLAKTLVGTFEEITRL